MGFGQAGKAGAIGRLPAAPNVQLRVAGVAWPMSGLTFRGKMDQILWDQGLSQAAPKPRPGQPNAAAPSNTEALSQAADSSKELSRDLKNSSDAQAKRKSDEIFGMRADTFEHQLGQVLAVVNDVPVERLRGKKEVAAHIKKSVEDARKHRLVFPVQYLRYGPMRQEVRLSEGMDAPLLQIERLAVKTEKISGGKEEFVKKFYKSLARLSGKWLKKARTISGSAAK